MAHIGLLFVILGWGYQLFSKGNALKPAFILIYSAGVVLLTVDGFMNDMTTLAVLNGVSLLTALAVLFKNRK
ncbi:MAG: hypothetical protein PHG63_04005 [Candidatus Dojkabacteria bacterium]|nr:hypothetical protein [Candidatus Dojkabacteria bacterium]